MLKGKVMIKRGDQQIDTLHIIGLTAENIELLMDKKPIAFQTEEIGLPCVGKVVILYGKTMEEIINDLVAAGMIEREPF